MRFYYFLGRLLSPFAAVGLRAYSYLTRTPRARLVVRNENGQVLLVQNWLGGGRWGLPGGGVERGEAPVEAAVRELEEEVGIVREANEAQSLFTIDSSGHKEVVFSLSVTAESIPNQLPNRFEIKEAAWFALDELPPLESLAERVMGRLKENADR